MMDDGTWKIKLLLFVVLIFAVSCYLSWQEFQYMGRGLKAEATFGHVYETREGVRSPRTVLKAEYLFTDRDGHERKFSISVPGELFIPMSEKLAVEYLPGPLGDVRCAGEHAYVAIIVVALSFGAVIFLFVKWWREASEPIGGRKTIRKASAAR